MSRKRLWLSTIAATALLASGCSESAGPTQVAAGEPQRVFAYADASHHLDNLFERLAWRVPGFGGFWFAGGQLHVALSHGIDESRAIATLKTLGIRRSDGRELDFTNVRVVRRNYAFAQLRDFEQRGRGLMHDVTLSFVDIDEVNGVVKYGVIDERDVSVLVRRLTGRGIPEDAVVVSQAPRLERDDDLQYSTFYPVPGAVGIQRDGSTAQCTLGFNVVHAVWGQSFVTASHCTSESWGGTGDTVRQPLLGYASLAVERVDPAGTSSLLGCYGGYLCRGSDAALFQYLRSWDAEQGSVARTYLGNNTVDPSQPRTSISNSYSCNPIFGWCSSTGAVGEQVEMTGALSGRQAGSIQSSCVQFFLTGQRQLVCQTAASYGRQGGDSGGPVLYSSTNAVAGTHVGPWNGGGAFSPITNIMSELGASMSQPCGTFQLAAQCYGAP